MDLFSSPGQRNVAAMSHPSQSESHREDSDQPTQSSSNPISTSTLDRCRTADERIIKTALVGVIKKLPKISEAHFLLGLLLLRQGDFMGAKENFEASLLYAESDEVARQSQSGENIDNPYKARILNHIAQCCQYLHSLASGDASMKSKVIQDKFVLATQLDNSQPDIWNNMGLMYLVQGKFEGSSTILKPVVKTFPEYIDAINNLGLAYLGMKLHDEAVRAFDEVLEKDPGHLDALNNKAVLLLQKGLAAPAIQCLESAILIDNRQPYIWNNLSVAYGFAGKIDQSEISLIKAYGISPENPNIAFNYGNMCWRNESTDEALAVLKKICSERSSSQVWNAIGNLHRQLRENPLSDEEIQFHDNEALVAYTRAIEVDGQDPVTFSNIGLLYFAKGDYAKAGECFKNAILKKRDFVAAWCNLGISLQLCDQVTDAEAVYKEALNLCPDAYQVYNNIGNMYRQKGLLDLSQKAYEKCLQINPTYALAYSNLGLLNIVLKQQDAAMVMFNKALDLDANLDCAVSNKLKLQVLMRQ